MNRLKKSIPFILTVAMLISAIFITKNFSSEAISKDLLKNDNTNVLSSDAKIVRTNTLPDAEMRAVWIPFMTFQQGSEEFSEENFKNKFNSMVEESKQYGINTLIVHVRPFSDAIYKSSIYPWSHVLTGTQGNAVNFDPLEYMIDKSHENNIKFHAWINPFRIKTQNTPQSLSESNPYNKWQNDSSKVLNFEGGTYYNPADEEVRKMIIDGVKELVENYAVDGIHFDDYFYPTDNGEYDKNSYDEYCSKVSTNSIALSQDDWRKANINLLISGVYSQIKSIDDKVQFGISPQANIDNDLKMGADIYNWGCKKGYVDYLCPQIYVNFKNPILPYDKAVQQWRDIITDNNINFYIGLGVYKAGSDADNGTWKTSDNILMNEIEYGRSLGCNGFMLYSWDYLKNNQTSKEVLNAMKVL